MSIDPKTFRRATKLQRNAIEALVNESFPTVARLSYGITGNDRAGDTVVAKIVRTGLRTLHKWRDEDEAHRWFLHHTILECRQCEPAAPGDDLLVSTAAAATPAYAAFVRALRSLPGQQVEAFLLNQGESLNARYSAVAMDCSVKAAEQHLAAAISVLRQLSAEKFDAHSAMLRAAYLSLTPAGRVQLPQVRKIVRRHVWPRRLARAAKLVGSIALIAAVAWFCYKVLPAIEY